MTQLAAQETEDSPRELMVPMVRDSEIDVQIATAHRYPRNITNFKKNALTMATQDEETAASCFYKLPRGGKEIEGPGVRLAEIVASAWGNLRFGARIIEETDKFIVAQGMTHDLETNVATTIEVRRRITDSRGVKYKDDMIAMTANAACSIALRNAIFKVVPKSYVDSIYIQAKSVAIGDASTLAARRTVALQYFAKRGVTEAQVLAKLEKAGVADIDLADMETLTGLKTALTDGDVTLDQIFFVKNQTSDSKTQFVLDKLKSKETANA